MKFDRLLEIVGNLPVFETGLLLAGDVDANDVRRQLSRWAADSRIVQLRKGLYMLAAPYQKTRPHPFVVANRMLHGSYVSLQSALAHYGLIPEYVPVTTSVSSRRPSHWDTPIGRFDFRFIKQSWLYGYRSVEVTPGQTAFVARPEKALLDLAYLHPMKDEADYLRGLRLQNMEAFDLEELRYLAECSHKPKLRRAAAAVAELARAEASEFVSL